MAQVERKSRYIGQLLKHGEFREREQNIIYERNLLKEREKDDHMFAGKEKFVTAAFKEKLKQDKLWEAEQAEREKGESHRLASTQGNMSSFYSNLLGLRGGGSSGLGGASRSVHDERNEEEDAKERERRLEESLPPSARRSLSPAADKKRGRADSGDEADRDQEEGRAIKRAKEEASRQDEDEERRLREAAAEAKKAKAQAAEEEAKAGEAQAAARAAAEAKRVENLGRRNDAEAVMSAKERYLARKAAKAKQKKKF